MPITVSTDIDRPLEVGISGCLDLRSASDVRDVLDLTSPEPVVIRVAQVGHVAADAIAHLAGSVRRARRAGRDVVVDALGATPLVELLLALVRLADLAEAPQSIDVSDEVAA